MNPYVIKLFDDLIQEIQLKRHTYIMRPEREQYLEALDECLDVVKYYKKQLEEQNNVSKWNVSNSGQSLI